MRAASLAALALVVLVASVPAQQGDARPGADTARTTRELGVAFRPIEETYRDTLAWMYRAGHLSAAHVGRLAS